MGHTLSIDAVINIIFGIAMTAIGVITIAQTAHLARLYSRSTDRSPWAPPECNLGPISQNCDRTPQMERWLELLHIGWMKI
jgi:hypothetical protein